MTQGTWRISAVSYYADWVTIPILGLAALLANVSYHGLTWLSPLAFLLGALVMTFIEYGVHRWVFHNPKLYRREHFVHHIRPADYVGLPSWQSGLYFVLALGGCIGSFGLDFGASFFVGLCAYYLTYIVAHDRFHHDHIITGDYWQPRTYWERRMADHVIHHTSGREVNFGVATPLWDMVLGTHEPA